MKIQEPYSTKVKSKKSDPQTYQNTKRNTKSKYPKCIYTTFIATTEELEPIMKNSYNFWKKYNPKVVCRLSRKHSSKTSTELNIRNYQPLSHIYKDGHKSLCGVSVLIKRYPNTTKSTLIYWTSSIYCRGTPYTNQ